MTNLAGKEMKMEASFFQFSCRLPTHVYFYFFSSYPVNDTRSAPTDKSTPPYIPVKLVPRCEVPFSLIFFFTANIIKLDYCQRHKERENSYWNAYKLHVNLFIWREKIFLPQKTLGSVNFWSTWQTPLWTILFTRMLSRANGKGTTK